MSVISLVQQLTIKNAAVTQGYVISVGENRKCCSHFTVCQEAGISFIPLVVELLGGWSKQATFVIQEFDKLWALPLG